MIILSKELIVFVTGMNGFDLRFHLSIDLNVVKQQRHPHAVSQYVQLKCSSITSHPKLLSWEYKIFDNILLHFYLKSKPVNWTMHKLKYLTRGFETSQFYHLHNLMYLYESCHKLAFKGTSLLHIFSPFFTPGMTFHKKNCQCLIYNGRSQIWY